MTQPKLSQSKENKPMHYSIGALIKKGDKYLLIDRAIFPFGFAGVAGHIDEGEKPEEALVREVKEESNLDVQGYKLLYEEFLPWDKCSKGIKGHHWYLFECKVTGKVKRDQRETKSIGWYTKEEIKKLKLEPAWEYWVKKLKII